MAKKKSILDHESRLSVTMGTAWQLIKLNILVLLCSIPIVTVGASVTAMHAVLLKIVRKEDAYLGRDYFQAWKENVGQATVLWLIKLAFILPVGVQLLTLLQGGEAVWPRPVTYAALTAGFAVFILMAFAFPLQSHFQNTIGDTLGNSFRLAVAKFPRAFVLAYIWMIPVFILLRILVLFPLVLLLGISLPGYICCRLYEPVFKELEALEQDTLSE